MCPGGTYIHSYVVTFEQTLENPTLNRDLECEIMTLFTELTCTPIDIKLKTALFTDPIYFPQFGLLF